MITAVVHVDTDVARVSEVAEAVVELPGVSEVYSVTGDADLVVVVRVAQHEDLATTIADGIGGVPGVTATRTYLAFRTHSRRDLDAAFALGADG